MPATQNDMTTCLENLRKGDVLQLSPIDTATCLENQRHFRHIIKQLGMSQSATPATQNDMTTCLETLEKERFCSFPHRHGDATGKPETLDKTRGCRKISISYETSSNLDIFDTLSNKLECHKVPRLPRKTTWQLPWKPSKRTGFAASPIDTANPQENQRLETRHVGAPKRAFRTRLPAIFSQLATWQKDKFCSFPHRHGEATGKPETRDETRGSTKTSISYETSSNFDTLQLQNRRFPTSFP